MSAPTPALPGVDDSAVFRSLFAAYPDALLVVDSQGRVALANPAAESLLGYPMTDLVGLSVDALVPDAIRPRHAAYRGAYAHNPRPRPMGTQMELVAKHRDGSEVMVEIALSPLQQPGLPYVVAAIRGIGAYPRVKQALRRAHYAEHVAQFGRFAVDARHPQNLLDQVVKVATEALQADGATVLLLDPSGTALRIASGVGLSPTEAIGSLLPHSPETPTGSVIEDGQAVVIGDQQTDPRFAGTAADHGARSVIAVPLADRGRTIGALTVHSLRPDRFADEELRFLDSLASLLATSLQRTQSDEALNHSQRLESVGQLTGGIAHDFNNLLTVISGNLQVLEELPVLAHNPAGLQLVGAASRAAKRGAELTGKLLAFSRRQVLQPSVVDATVLLGSLTDMLRRTLDQRIEIKLDVASGCPPCLADPGQLESALLNVAINARDAMPDGGVLAFACHLRPLPAGVKDDLAEASGQPYVAISISDSGGGMPDAVKERAFEPFFTTKDAGRGTGLGLSTVYGFATQSRGAVTLDSRPGAGTTVTLYLPRGDQPAPPPVDPLGESDGFATEGLHVLLVEDDAEVRAVVQAFLTSLGCTVTSCATGEEALAVVISTLDVGLLLTDIALGAGIGGMELARQAQQHRPALKVLLMSGFASGLLDRPPGWHLLRKPYGRDELGRAIAKVLGH